MHDKTRTTPERSLVDYLCGDSTTELFIVGDLPQPILDNSVTGVSIHTLDSLDAAQRLASQPATSATADQSSADVARALVLALDPSDSQFEQRLGRAVRAFPHRVLLHCTTTDVCPGRPDEDFFAFGFRRLAVARDADEPDVSVRWFEYRLSQYKPAPDWLNAKFWANPHRFDLDDDLDEYDDDDD